jgi:hypothetical protein
VSDDERQLFESALREHVRTMSDDDFDTFVAETRPPTPRSGDAGRAAAAKRFGREADPKAAVETRHRGAGGRAEAARRFNNQGQR